MAEKISMDEVISDIQIEIIRKFKLNELITNYNNLIYIFGKPLINNRIKLQLNNTKLIFNPEFKSEIITYNNNNELTINEMYIIRDFLNEFGSTVIESKLKLEINIYTKKGRGYKHDINKILNTFKKCPIKKTHARKKSLKLQLKRLNPEQIEQIEQIVVGRRKISKFAKNQPEPAKKLAVIEKDKDRNLKRKIENVAVCLCK